MPIEWPAGLRDGFNAAAHFLYPECCQFCDRRATPAEGYVCPQCWKDVRFIVPPFCERCGRPFAGDVTTEFECNNCRELELHFSRARSAVVARGVAMDAIQRFKYNRALWFEPFLADLLVRTAATELRADGWNLIAPVPLHPAKLAEREFNQAERLARQLADATGLELHADLLRRTKMTQTQTRLSRQQRADNVRGAFVLPEKLRDIVKDRRIVLVDDVFTTGATTSACAEPLREAGAADVCVWTVARGLGEVTLSGNNS